METTSTINIEQTIEKPTGTKVIVTDTKIEKLKKFIDKEGVVISWNQKREASNKKRKVMFNSGTDHEEIEHFYDDELRKIEE